MWLISYKNLNVIMYIYIYVSFDKQSCTVTLQVQFYSILKVVYEVRSRF
jgi:hypothetical protein